MAGLGGEQGCPRLNETLAANEVAITFVNHTTFLIQTVGISILTDPVWSERASPFAGSVPRTRPKRHPGSRIREPA
jgi:L-ascorbate metabolism protein UlaG (beta-lactamase superfamily)